MRARLISYMEKIAASKWRTLVRSGEATPGMLSGLKEMGLHGTPEAYAREIRGLNRGTRLLSRKNRIMHEALPQVEAGEMSGSMRPVDKAPLDVYNENSNIEKLRSKRSNLLWALRSQKVHAGKKDVDFRNMMPSEKDSSPRLRNWLDKNPEFIQPSGPVMSTRTVRVAPAKGQHAQNALIRRHEVDEALLHTPDSRDGTSAKMFASHASPEVIAREAGHSNFLPPTLIKSNDKYRRAETNAISRTLAGVPAPAPLPAKSTINDIIARNKNIRQTLTGEGLPGQLAQADVYNKFYGTYYGMPKARRQQFDTNAIAQFG